MRRVLPLAAWNGIAFRSRPPFPQKISLRVAPDLLESLSKDPEAATSHFIALAYPLPNLSLDWLGEKMRLLTKENDDAP